MVGGEHSLKTSVSEVLQFGKVVLLHYFSETPAPLLKFLGQHRTKFSFILVPACIVPGTAHSIVTLALLFLFYCLGMSGGPDSLYNNYT